MWELLRRRFLGALLTLLFAATLACGSFEPTPPPSEDFVGSWVAVDDKGFIQIGQNGHVNYRRNQGAGHKELNLPAKEWSASSFTVGALGMSTTFTIDSPPEQIEGIWYMTLDGVEYTRTP